MGLDLERKQAVVAEVAARLGKAQAVIVAEYRGLGVGAVTGLNESTVRVHLFRAIRKLRTLLGSLPAAPR